MKGGPSIQPLQQRCASLGPPFVFPRSQTLKYRRKKKTANPNDAMRLGARFGWKRLQRFLKWFKRCRRELPCKSSLGLTLEENGEVKCQASHHTIVCKIALNSMSAVSVKTKDVEHSFVTWWGSMCRGGAWGQGLHQTSHAAFHYERACNPLHC